MRKAIPGQLGKHIHQHIFTAWVSLESESPRVSHITTIRPLL